MKTNPSFLNTLLMAVTLAFCLQARAVAQPDGGTNTPPPAQGDAGAASANGSSFRDNVEFFFPGGTPDEFLSAIEKQYKVDWEKVADIPPNLREVRIPALRMNRQSGGRGDTQIYAETIRALEVRRIEAMADYIDHSDILDRLKKLGTNNLLPSAMTTVLRGQNDQELILRIERLTRAQDALAQVREQGYGPESFEAKTAQKQVDNEIQGYKEKIAGIMNGLEGLVAHEKNLLDTINEHEDEAKTESGRRHGGDPLSALVALYNSLQKADPELGNLQVEGDLAQPSIVIFHSDAPHSTLEPNKMKAFALRGIPTNEWPKLEAEIRSQFEGEYRRQREMAAAGQGSEPGGFPAVSVNRDTGLLVVIGPESYVEAAESWVSAWHSNQAKTDQSPASDMSIKVFKLAGIPEKQQALLFHLTDEQLQKLATKQGSQSHVAFDDRTGSIIATGTASILEAAELIVDTAFRLNQSPEPTVAPK